MIQKRLDNPHLSACRMVGGGDTMVDTTTSCELTYVDSSVDLLSVKQTGRRRYERPPLKHVTCCLASCKFSADLQIYYSIYYFYQYICRQYLNYGLSPLMPAQQCPLSP